MKYESVIFDLDGTLSDPSEGIFRCLHHAFDAVGRPELKNGNLGWFIGPPIFESFCTVLDGSEADAELALNHYRVRYGSVGKFENELYADIPELLDTIRERGLKIYLATSKPHDFAHDILRHFGLTDRFADIQGHDVTDHRETKTQVMRRLLDRNPIDPAKALMVGDRSHDVQASFDFGIACVGVRWGFGQPEEFDRPNVVATISAPLELISVLDARTPGESIRN